MTPEPKKEMTAEEREKLDEHILRYGHLQFYIRKQFFTDVQEVDPFTADKMWADLPLDEQRTFSLWMISFAYMVREELREKIQLIRSTLLVEAAKARGIDNKRKQGAMLKLLENLYEEFPRVSMHVDPALIAKFEGKTDEAELATT